MQDGSFQLRVEDVLRAILKQRYLIIIMTLVGMVAGGVLTFAAYMQGELNQYYRLKASIAVSMQTGDGDYASSGKTNPVLSDVQMANQIMESVVYVLNSDLLAERAAALVKTVDCDAADIADALSVSRVDETLIAELSLTWDTVDEGTVVLNAVLDAVPGVLQETFQIGGISVVTQPHMTASYGGSINKMLFLLIAALGMFGGVGIAVLQLFIAPTLMDIRDVENKYGLNVLGEIPLENGYFDKKLDLLAEAENRGSVIAECYSSCAHILRNQLGVGNEHVCVYVTSSIHGEGKTLAAAYLGANLASMEKRVLLIDFDTKKPTLGSLFLPEVLYEHSVNALYRGDIELVDALVPINGFLDILPAVLERNPIPLDNAIFEMVRQLKERYDIIIIDTEPVGLSSNTMNLNSVADTALFVLRYDYTSNSEIRNALGRLDKSGIQVLGCVVNAIQSLDSLLGKTDKKKSTAKASQPRPVAAGEPEKPAPSFEKPEAIFQPEYAEKTENVIRPDEDVQLPPISLEAVSDHTATDEERKELNEVLQDQKP